MYKKGWSSEDAFTESEAEEKGWRKKKKKQREKRTVMEMTDRLSHSLFLTACQLI